MRIVFLVMIVVLLGTCSEPPSLVQQIQTLGELRVLTRNSPTTFYLGPEGPVGPRKGSRLKPLLRRSRG